MNVRKIKLWPKATMKSASNGNELSDERSELKHCVTENQHSNPFPKSPGPSKNPPGNLCHRNWIIFIFRHPISCMVNKVVWSNPTFWRSDEGEDSYDVGSNNIVEDTRQTDRYGFCVPTPSSLVFSFNLSLERKGSAFSEAARSNPRCCESMKTERRNEVVCEDFPKSRSEVRNAGRMSEAEANIRAELAREIEKELELELEQQIAILTCRLQNLRMQRKSEIPVHGLDSSSLLKKTLPQNQNNNKALRSGSVGSLSMKGCCSGTDVLAQSGSSRQPRRVAFTESSSSVTNCREMRKDKRPSSMEKMNKLNVSQSFNSVDKTSKAHLFRARTFKTK